MLEMFSWIDWGALIAGVIVFGAGIFFALMMYLAASP